MEGSFGKVLCRLLAESSSGVHSTHIQFDQHRWLFGELKSFLGAGELEAWLNQQTKETMQVLLGVPAGIRNARYVETPNN